MTRTHNESRRPGLLVVALAAVVVLLASVGYVMTPRHYPVQVSAEMSPEDVVDRYIAASNHHACADADALLAPGAQYSFCPPVWRRYYVRGYRVIRVSQGMPSETNSLRGWNETRVVAVDMDVDTGWFLPIGPGGQVSTRFGLGRNSASEPWKIVQIGFI